MEIKGAAMLLLEVLLDLVVSWHHVLSKVLVSLPGMILELPISSLDQAIHICQ